MPLVLGLDCGGSNTRAIALDEVGSEHFRGAGGPANIASTPPDTLTRSLRDATSGSPPVEAVAGCFAGLLTKADKERAEAALKERFPMAKVQAWPDYAAALAADPDVDGIMICGTGSVCAWWEDGELKKHGGGGPLLGDAGSAFDLGKRFLWRALWGSEPWSPNLVQHFQDRYQSQEPNEIIAAIYRSEQPAAEIALAARVVVDDWEQGLPGADRLIRDHLYTILIQLACLSWPGSRIGLTGGFWKLSPRLLPWLIEVDREEGLKMITGNGVTIKLLAAEPVKGAANLARRLLSS